MGKTFLEVGLKKKFVLSANGTDLAAAVISAAAALSAAASTHLNTEFGYGPEAAAEGGTAVPGICFSVSLRRLLPWPGCGG